MRDRIIHVSNDNGMNQPRTLGRRTFCSLNIIEGILYDINRGHVHFPAYFVENLQLDRSDIVAAEHVGG
jgi:hypothetical protein